ncbi:transporter substrate-binding domain-containing protein [Maliponia aquimaris]|uniref:General L-amino acid-binding periplasmic protein AapJ n=1 Tax=Maliponia aquimaris TaxID=1673631 RepID=A0A238KQX4_9RHOB|nr:transporter substrate-binding domain-containing protein [Maliponia aquimaris]SMX45060.1 General L-amino acid-binding periplasmic protein AapJ precursor [Maliponia aquimaris]
MTRWFQALCLLVLTAGAATAQDLRDCGFGFDVDRQSSAFQSMIVDGQVKRGFWLSINRAPADVRSLARHVGRLQVCLITPDGKPRTITRGGETFELESPFLSNCTAALLPDNRLLTNNHCYYDPDLVKAGFTVVREARINFNYTSRDDTGAVRTYLVSPRELALDKDLDALVLQIVGGDANTDLGGHIPMKMMSRVEPFQELRMIHHPGAEPQQYSTGTCQVHRRQTEIPDDRSPLRHTCESTGGSSGSLLLDAQTLAVVALHNQGGLEPSGDSFNSGHKIAMINQVLNLGFEEFRPETGSDGDAATRALANALLMFDPVARAEALKKLTADFPGTDAADKAVQALGQIEDAARRDRETRADRALTAALLTADRDEKIAALAAVTRDHDGLPAAQQAALALERLTAAPAPAPVPTPAPAPTPVATPLPDKPKDPPPAVATAAPALPEMTLADLSRTAGRTQQDVIARGRLNCGVNTGLPGFSAPDDRGRWSGLDTEFCRAIAAAVLGDPEAVEFVPLTAITRFTALASGEVDVLARNTSWTLSRDSDLAFNAAGITLYDGLGLMVKRDLGVTSALHLDGATVCTTLGTNAERDVDAYFKANGMSYEPLLLGSYDEQVQAYNAGRCDVLTSDRTLLAVTRAAQGNPQADMILPEILSREPLSLMVRHGDEGWRRLVAGVVDGLKRAEELDIRQVDAARLRRSDDPLVRALTGGGAALNLPQDAILRVVAAVGNYGEIYDRTLGDGTELNLPRGLNALWTQGGLTHGSPIRAAAAASYAEPRSAAYNVIDTIRSRDSLNCGVQVFLPPLAQPDNTGGFAGLGPDLCRALAAAILGDPAKVTWVLGTDSDWSAMLMSGAVDIVPAPQGFDAPLWAEPHVVASSPYLYAGIGAIVPRSSGIVRLADLDGRRACMVETAPWRAELSYWQARSGVHLTDVPAKSTADAYRRYLQRDCDSVIDESLALASAALIDGKALRDHGLIGDALSLRPLSAALPAGDDRWADVVNWTIFTLMAAEELGIDGSNVRALAQGGTGSPEIDRLLGTEGDLGARLGLDTRWAVEVIAAVSGYDALYGRNLGSGSGLNWPRGLNAQWTKGGLIYAPPVR